MPPGSITNIHTSLITISFCLQEPATTLIIIPFFLYSFTTLGMHPRMWLSFDALKLFTKRNINIYIYIYIYILFETSFAQHYVCEMSLCWWVTYLQSVSFAIQYSIACIYDLSLQLIGIWSVSGLGLFWRMLLWQRLLVIHHNAHS